MCVCRQHSYCQNQRFKDHIAFSVFMCTYFIFLNKQGKVITLKVLIWYRNYNRSVSFTSMSKGLDRLTDTHHKNNKAQSGLEQPNYIKLNKWNSKRACLPMEWHGQWRSIYFKTVSWAAGSSLLAEPLPECISAATKARLGTILTGRSLLSDGILIKCFLFAAHCSESWWLSALNHKAHLGVLHSQ